MNWLSSAVISVCFCGVAVGIIESLLPNDTYKNGMRLITGTVLLICMLSPFLNNFDFDASDFKFDFNTDYSTSIEQSVAKAAKNEIEEIIKENDIDYAKITIETSKDENGSIILSSADILFNEKDMSKSEKIRLQAQDKLNIDVKIGEIS